MLWAANAVKGYGANQASTIVADAFVTKFYIIGAFKRLAYFGFSPNQKFTMTSAAGTDISDGFLLGMEDAGAPGALESPSSWDLQESLMPPYFFMVDIQLCKLRVDDKQSSDLDVGMEARSESRQLAGLCVGFESTVTVLLALESRFFTENNASKLNSMYIGPFPAFPEKLRTSSLYLISLLILVIESIRTAIGKATGLAAGQSMYPQGQLGQCHIIGQIQNLHAQA